MEPYMHLARVLGQPAAEIASENELERVALHRGVAR
jgi:uncharacterized phage protein gp47/JayE